jgi:hypothetical protein
MDYIFVIPEILFLKLNLRNKANANFKLILINRYININLL